MTSLLKLSAILWAVWGAFHVFVGVFLLVLLVQGKTADALHGIAGTVPLKELQIVYPFAAVATLKQHAFNLAWFGLVTLVGSIWVWRLNAYAIFICALVARSTSRGAIWSSIFTTWTVSRLCPFRPRSSLA